MDTYTIEYWQDHFDELISRVENGETIGITDGKNTAVMVPYNDYCSFSNLVNAPNS